jgi:hypothetical protein
MLYDVIGATYRGDYLIEIEFDDGSRGLVDFSKYLQRSGVFERFRDLAYFRRFVVNEDAGTLTWGNEVDIAPETLYAEATGRGLPAWTESDQAGTTDRHIETGGLQPSVSGRR